MAALMFNTPWAFKQQAYRHTIGPDGTPYAGQDLGAKRASNYTPPAGFEIIAEQGQTISLDQATDVAYGAAGSFNYKSEVTGSIIFDDATFGDPLPGYFKAGYRRKAITATASDAASQAASAAVTKSGSFLKKYGLIALAVLVVGGVIWFKRKKS
jgi:hypothetical protein